MIPRNYIVVILYRKLILFISALIVAPFRLIVILFLKITEDRSFLLLLILLSDNRNNISE